MRIKTDTLGRFTTLAAVTTAILAWRYSQRNVKRPPKYGKPSRSTFGKQGIVRGWKAAHIRITGPPAPGMTAHNRIFGGLYGKLFV